MKVFISGPMSGMLNYNREAFFKAQEKLEKHGYSVWNPAWLAYPSDTEFSKDAIHAIDNEALRHCDAIYMLKGWRLSEGARNEHNIALARDLIIMYEEECYYSFKFDSSKVTDKGDIKENHNTFDDRLKAFDYVFAWEKWKNKLPDSIGSNKIDSLEKKYNDLADELDANIDRIDTDFDMVREDINGVIDDIKDFKKYISNNLYELQQVRKDIGSIVQKRHDDNRVVNNNLNDLNIRLKAIEKRLNIKPFYAPTEDEKDDD